MLLWNASLPEIILAGAGIAVGSFVMIYFAVKFFFSLSGADIFLQTKKSQTLIITAYTGL
jgi:hypothetical protein